MRVDRSVIFEGPRGAPGSYDKFTPRVLEAHRSGLD